MSNFLKKMLVVPLAAFLFACSGSAGDETISAMPLADVMDAVYADIPSEDMPMFPEEDTVITKDNAQWYLGTTEVVYDEAIAREPLIGSIAHSTVLLRVEDESEIDTAMELIRNSVNTNKWVCVGIDPNDMVLEKKGDVILLVIVDDAALRDKLVQNFENI